MKLLMLPPTQFTKAEVSEDKRGLSAAAQQLLVAPGCPRRRVQEAQCLAHPLHKSTTGTAGRKNFSNTAWQRVSDHKDEAVENWEWQAKETSLIKS